MSGETNEAVLRAALDALGEGDLQTYMAMFASNFRFRLQGSTPISGEIVGPDNFAAWAAQVMTRLQYFQQTNVQFLPCGEWIVTRDRGDALTIEGKRYDNDYARFWRFEDGKCVEMIEYLDTQLLVDSLLGAGR